MPDRKEGRKAAFRECLLEVRHHGGYFTYGVSFRTGQMISPISHQSSSVNAEGTGNKLPTYKPQGSGAL